MKEEILMYARRLIHAFGLPKIFSQEAEYLLSKFETFPKKFSSETIATALDLAIINFYVSHKNFNIDIDVKKFMTFLDCNVKQVLFLTGIFYDKYLATSRIQ